MKNPITLFLLLFISMGSSGQITSVNTACTGDPVNFTGPVNGITYTWSPDSIDINQAPGTFSTAGLSGLNKATFASTNYDNGTWYTFITDHPNNTLRRLTYSTDPNGTYTVSTVGTYGTAGELEGIDIVKDPATGNWYGLTANDGLLFLLSFGSSLANAPSSTTYNFSTYMSWPHQVGLAKYGNNWIGFIGDRNSTIKRVDFGTSLSNTPTMTNISNVGSVSNPCNFAIHKENGNWYMLVTSLTAGRISRYNFGTNINNNSPSGVSLGNPGSQLSIARSIIIVNDCNQLIAYVLNESNGLIKLNFGTSITNTPSATNVGPTGISSQNSMNTYFVDTAMYLNIVSFGSNSLSRGRLLSFPTSSQTNYYNNSYTHTFSTAGTKDITLYVNQGSPMGAESYCKSILIKGGKTLRDTNMCVNDSVILDASAAGAATYSWSTGATTPGIKVYSGGTYWVKYTGATCVAADTAVVTTTPLPGVFLGADTALCDTNYMLMNKLSTPPGATYAWSTGSTGSSVKAVTGGSYWLEVTKDGCSGSDTIALTVTNMPKVQLGNDTSVCAGSVIMLSNHGFTPPGASYTWSNGGTTSFINVMPGTHWLTIQENGCKASDTITISQVEPPNVWLGDDTGVCADESITLANLNTAPAGANYLWSTGRTNATVTVGPGTYWLTITANGCDATDTINIIQYPLPSVALGNDTTICRKHEITLRNAVQTNGAAYQWSNGSKADTIVIKGPGTYRLTVTDTNGCKAKDEIAIAEYEDPYISLGSDKDLCNGEKVKLPFEVKANGPYSIKWSDGSTDTILIVKETGIYTAVLTDICGTVQDEMYAKFNTCDLFFPSAFTPNGDNYNDIARIRGDLDGIQAFELSIYNRWGQRVFNTTNPLEGWDGTFKGKAAELSTYYYMIPLKFRGKEFMMKGDITLLR